MGSAASRSVTASLRLCGRRPCSIAWLLAVSAISCLGSFYSMCLFQSALFQGESGGGHDFGLATLVPMWVFACFWTAFACWPISICLFGRGSWMGFLLGGPFHILPGLVFWLLSMLLGVNSEDDFHAIYGPIFRFLSLGGMFSEGRLGTGEHLAVYALNVYIGTLGGLAITFRGKVKSSLARLLTPGSE